MTQKKTMAKALEPPKGDDGQSSDSDNDYADDDDLTMPPAHILPKDNVQAAFEEIITKARNKELNLSNREMRNAFIDHYGDVLVKKTQTYSQTLLHLIANTVEHKSLTRCLVRKDKTLLGSKDDHGKTALHIAIEKKNYYFLEIVLKEIPDRNLITILQMECEHGRNCIHLAIYHNLKKEYTTELIQRASEATLCATDQNGLTPLHLAVEYQRSSEEQLSIVHALIIHGDGAMDRFTITPRDLSVYEYQGYTRNQAVKKLPEPLTNRGAEKSQEEHHDGIVSRQEHSLTKSNGGMDPSPGTDMLPRHHKADRGRGPAKPDIISGKRSLSIMPLPVNTTFDHVPFAPIPEEGKSPVKGAQIDTDLPGFVLQKPERRTTGSGPRNSNRDDELVRQPQEHEKRRAEYADKIRQELKLYYLRSTFMADPKLRKRDQLKASRFLHGANIDNINLCFDYSEAPKLISEESFRQSYGHMSFDEVLRYVTLHHIKLQKPAKPATGSKASKILSHIPKEGKGRDDVTFLFKWLYEKRVRHILKVTVDDMEDPPHSDKAIEESLGRFEVEILDWCRMDLCPETLYRACPNVQELYLRWSGNRVMLRAWGEPEGLPRLKKLEKVHLVWNSEQTLESAERIEMYIKDFQKRLDQTMEPTDVIQRNREKQSPYDTNDDGKGAKRKILIYTKEVNIRNGEHLVLSGDSTKTLTNANERNLQSNRWLECMDKFADEIQNIRVPDIDSVNLKRDIKVALIDDGVDPEVESLRGKIKGGESFDRGYPHENGPSPYYSSSKGHGTVMAEMICRVCPMVKLYVYKLETYSSINPATLSQTADQISAESAALAVRAAVDQNVDIISMSWTVKQVEDNLISISQLGEAIKVALDAGILLFCAAADTGAVTEVEFPWSYDQRRIFRIGAATADGRIWGPTGSPDKVNFILPGHNVVSRNPHREAALPSDFKELTGSSIATALAAGLAALILHCVRLGAIYSEMEMQQNISSAMAVKAADFQRLKNPHNMNGVLKAIGLDEGQQRFIEVWKRFDGPTQNLKFPNNWSSGGAEPSKLEIVAKLARDFVSGIAGGS